MAIPAPEFFYREAGRALGLYLGGPPDAVFQEDANGWYSCSGEPEAWFNLAMVYGEDYQSRLADYADRFQAAGVRSEFLLSNPAAGEAAGLAMKRGYRIRAPYPLMARRVGKVEADASPWEIQLARSSEDLETTHAIQAATSGLRVEHFRQAIPADLPSREGSRLYLARQAGKPVATGWLYFTENSAGLHSMATLHEFQGRGAGRALVAAMLDEARREGVEWAYLFSSESGLRLYAACGFQTIALVSLWEN